MHITPYTEEHKPDWDHFVSQSRNGTFLFLRDYMDYHKDRFVDASLMIWEENDLLAVLPGSLHNEEWRSHGGLTYGGFVAGRDFRASTALLALEAVMAHLGTRDVARMVIKPVPHIYHRMPSEEELYALFRCGAKLARRDLASSLMLSTRYSYSKGRKSSLSKARREGVVVAPSSEWKAFMAMEEALLMEKHNTRPAHTAEEIRLLAERFPNQIQLIAATREQRMLAGVITYSTDTVCHAQYIASTPEGRDLGAVDAVIDHAIGESCATWFDFGISTTNQGMHLDESLAANKEGYGARATTYDHYLLEL